MRYEADPTGSLRLARRGNAGLNHNDATVLTQNLSGIRVKRARNPRYPGELPLNKNDCPHS
jgi:hypothetical protein